MNRWRWLGLMLVTGAALVLRLPDLGRRPLHNDEGVNALKLRDLWQEGRFAYDPQEFHGPTLFYASLPFVWLSGAKDFDHLTEAQLRRVTVAFGVALVLLAFLFADVLGWPAMWVAAALTALSPAMVFYSRYLIHEMLLVVFTALFVGSGWRWGQTGKLTWAMASGAGLGLMYATKETFVFPLCAVTIANAAVAVWRRCVRPSLGRPVDASQCGTLNPKSEIGQGLFVSAATNRWWGLALLATTAGVIGFVLFTSFFTNRGGPLDSILTYQPWLHRAQGASPHIYPWSFYLERLAWFHWPKGQVWSEGAILVLALVGAVAAIVGRGITSRGVWPVRWLTVYTFVLTAIYSVVAYKTPWCLLGFLHGMILLAGVGAVALWNWMQSPAARAGLAIALGAAGLQLTWQSWQASFVFFASRQNPYVYAQTTPDILALVQRAEAIAAVHPAGRSTIVKVIAPDGDYGPLPYYLRRLGHVLWSDAMPNDPYAPVMIVSARFGAELDEKSGKRYLMARLYELRPGTFFELYVELELWKKYLATLPPPPE